MKTLRYSYLSISLIASFSMASGQNKPPRPNIIFLMSDQQRWNYIGKIDPGVKTPALDNIAKDGVIFSQAVCQAPMCVPSRYSLMTGLYPPSVGVFRNGESLNDENMPCDALPEVLRKAGYQTAGFGKTHWSSKNCSTRGFDVRYIGHGHDVNEEKGAVMMVDNNPDGFKRYNEETKDFGSGEERPEGYLGITSKVAEKDHRDGWVFNECLKFLDRGVDAKKPLFLYLSFLKPHAANNIPAGYEDLYKLEDMPVPEQPAYNQVEPNHATGTNRENMYRSFWSKANKGQWQQMILRYRANCTWIDSMFGRVLDKLKTKGLLDNCLIVFVSDHGEMLGERYYRFNKYCLFENSVRVPMILGGTVIPKEKRGTIDKRPAELVDIFPTILKVAGITNINKPGLDLLGKKQKAASYCEIHERKDTASYMWRNNDFKLILSVSRKEKDITSIASKDIIAGELYDLKSDEREWNNVYNAEKYAIIQNKMTKALLEHIGKIKPHVIKILATSK